MFLNSLVKSWFSYVSWSHVWETMVIVMWQVLLFTILVSMAVFRTLYQSHTVPISYRKSKQLSVFKEKDLLAVINSTMHLISIDYFYHPTVKKFWQLVVSNGESFVSERNLILKNFKGKKCPFFYNQSPTKQGDSAIKMQKDL